MLAMEYNLAKKHAGWLFKPILAPILAEQAQAGLIALLAGLHLGCTLAGWGSFWRCPIYAATGVPCPGCYLGQAMALILTGQPLRALALHAFAPVFLFGILLVGSAAVLPDAERRSLAEYVSRLENRTGITAWLLIALILYWGFRLLWIGFG